MNSNNNDDDAVGTKMIMVVMAEAVDGVIIFDWVGSKGGGNG